jgi:hypothetical protein
MSTFQERRDDASAHPLATTVFAVGRELEAAR